MAKKQAVPAVVAKKPVVAKKQAPVAKRQPASLPAVIDDHDDAGAGFEEATAASYAIPFLGVLQKGSPQVDKAAGGELIDGAEEGMLFNTVTKALFDGEEGVAIIPCYYRRTFIRWGGDNGGFKGELDPKVVEEMRGRGELAEEDNRLWVLSGKAKPVNQKKDDLVSETHNIFCVVCGDNGVTPALLSLSRTQIKKAKQIMSALHARTVKTPDGIRPMAMYRNRVRVTTAPESNDKGSWFGINFRIEGNVDDADELAAARAFHETVKAGRPRVNYDEAGDVAQAHQEGV